VKTKNFISIYDNALTPEECKSMIDYFESNDEYWSLRQDGMMLGDTIIKEWKDSQDRTMVFNNNGYFQDNLVNQIILKSINFYIEKYKEENPEVDMLYSWALRNSYNLQKYEPNGGYRKLHCENYNTGDYHSNVLVWMFYLNTVKEGGGTYFSNYDLTINAVEGRLVIWPPYWTHMHKGVVSETSEKYIATGWFCLIEDNIKNIEKE
jgi:hypothetical protein|tara:strand:+ start:69 stop:689 length:621 start_codon:yes stop_codon:yes gene_type:complete